MRARLTQEMIDEGNTNMKNLYNGKSSGKPFGCMCAIALALRPSYPDALVHIQQVELNRWAKDKVYKQLHPEALAIRLAQDENRPIEPCVFIVWED